MASVWGELKRRNVVKVAVAYAVVGWLLIEVASVLLPTFLAPDWVMRVFSFAIIAGFPLAVVLAWAFDITPEGIKTASEAEHSQSTTKGAGRKLDFAIIGALVLALGFVGLDNYVLNDREERTGVLPNSIAVLPCDNLSPDPDNAYFAAGIHEEVLNQLVKIRDLNVIARTSVLQYAGAARPIPEIAQELNVGNVMECSVSYAEGRVAIAAQLIDSETGVHLWSERYNREFADIFGIQADIATAIAMSLEAQLLPNERQNIERVATQVPEANAAYLRARALIPEISPLAPLDFYVHLDDAITLDPLFALAHATKAFAYSVRINGGILGPFGEPLDEMQALVRQHADQAIALDSSQGLAHAARAMLDQQHFLEAAARANFDQALEFSPNNADILDNLVRFNLASGHFEEAVQDLTRIAELNPSGLLGLQPDVNLYLGNYAAAATQAQIAVEVYGGGPFMNAWAALASAAAGDTQLAAENLRTAEESLGEVPSPQFLAALVAGYGQIGQRTAAERLLNRLEELYEAGPDSSDLYPFWAAAWSYAYSGIGDREQALRWLNRLASTRDPSVNMYWSSFLIANAFAFPLLDEDEFVEIRSRLGFGQ